MKKKVTPRFLAVVVFVVLAFFSVPEWVRVTHAELNPSIEALQKLQEKCNAFLETPRMDTAGYLEFCNPDGEAKQYLDVLKKAGESDYLAWLRWEYEHRTLTNMYELGHKYLDDLANPDVPVLR